MAKTTLELDEPLVELDVETEPPDDIELHELLRQLAKKARGRGWDLPKLQDRVYAHFETADEPDAEG